MLAGGDAEGGDVDCGGEEGSGNRGAAHRGGQGRGFCLGRGPAQSRAAGSACLQQGPWTAQVRAHASVALPLALKALVMHW